MVCFGGLNISENLKVIDNALELSYSQQQFSKKFEDFFDLRKKIEFSFPGGVTEGTIFFSEGSDFWYGHRVTKSPRYWNAFGITDPFKTKKLPITCEINFPMDKINRRIAGVFAIDEKGQIHVLHRGKIGGNYSKSVFEKFYEGEWLEVVDGNKNSELVYISSINDPKFINNVQNFVLSINKIKSLSKKL